MFDFNNYSIKTKYYDNSKTNYSLHKYIQYHLFLLPARISDIEYKYILWSKKYMRHSMNRIQSKEYKTGTYEINKISLSCFDDKIYIQNNVDTLALGARVNIVIPW